MIVNPLGEGSGEPGPPSGRVSGDLENVGELIAADLLSGRVNIQ
jgi:hypothetical protein